VASNCLCKFSKSCDNASNFSNICGYCQPLTRGAFAAVQIWSHWRGQAKCMEWLWC